MLLLGRQRSSISKWYSGEQARGRIRERALRSANNIRRDQPKGQSWESVQAECKEKHKERFKLATVAQGSGEEADQG